MSTNFKCVGGPLDGQMVNRPDGQIQFNVANPPACFDMPTFGTSAAVESVAMTITYATYRLKHHTNGYAWICE